MASDTSVSKTKQDFCPLHASGRERDNKHNKSVTEVAY